MKRTKARRTRWSATTKAAMPSAAEPGRGPVEKEIRDVPAPTLGPYEAAYDISEGYAHDRSIVLP